MNRRLPRPPTLGICLAIVLSAAVALAGRYGLMENETLGTTCRDTGASALCTPWAWLPQVFVNNRIGILALALAVIGTVLSRRVPAWIGLVLGTAGLVLYCFEWSALAAVASLVLLLRLPAR